MPVPALQHKALLLLLALVTVAFLWMVGAFLLPAFWAVVLAVVFRPVFDRFRRWFGGRSAVASLLTLVVILVLVVVPLVAVGAAVTQEAVGLYGQVARGEIDLSAPIDRVESWMPEVSRRAADYNVDLDKARDGLEQGALEASRTVASRLLDAGQGVVRGALMLVVAFYVLFFLLRDGDRLVAALVRALPLGDARERRLLTRFADVTRATVKGTFVVAVVQGALGGMAFAMLGLRAPVLWGVLMGLLSLIPALGSALVWGPAVVYLFAVGAVGKAVILLVVGTGLIGLADNVLRPILVGRGAGMPDYLILLSTLGGLAVFGVSGLVVGPVVAGLFLTVWDLAADEWAEDVVHDPVPVVLVGDPAVAPALADAYAVGASPAVGGPADAAGPPAEGPASGADEDAEPPAAPPAG